jgi:hypothetical protein
LADGELGLKTERSQRESLPDKIGFERVLSVETGNGPLGTCFGRLRSTLFSREHALILSSGKYQKRDDARLLFPKVTGRAAGRIT